MDMFDLGETFGGMNTALKRVICPVMVMGAQSDILFPIAQQREMSRLLKEAGTLMQTFVFQLLLFLLLERIELSYA